MSFSLGKLTGNPQRPPFEGIYIYLFAVLVGYGVADLSILSFRQDMLPAEAPPARMKKAKRKSRTFKSDYDVVARRNIFNSDGKIPDPLSATDEEPEDLKDAPAVPSQLPLKLLGTLVHANPDRSIATVNLSSKNKTAAFKVGESLEGIATVTKVERRKITFRNTNNGRLEYIEMPEDSKINFGMKAPSVSSDPGKVVQKSGEFDFNIKREDVTKYTSNLSSILNEARMVPNRPPGGGGVEGFRFTSIKPGSIFEKLGFKPNDVIKGVNGEPVNSPTKAMELFNTLKSANDLELSVERGGRDQEFRYTIE